MSGTHLAIGLMLLLVINILVMILTAFFGGYGKKKGENLATKEDLNNLVDQVKAVTQATKEIEAKIADQSSSRHRLLEMRREVAFELINMLGDLEEILIEALYQAQALEKIELIQPQHTEKLDELYARYKQLLRRMVQLKGQVALVFDDPARELLQGVDNAAAAIITTTNKFHYTQKKGEDLITLYNERCVKLRLLIRQQLLA
jgi:hypothetical protein